MSRLTSNAISACLIGTGVAAWAFAGRPLVADPDLAAPLNPLGINGSTYGEVFAMAMQGPIDTHFHEAMGTGFHQHVEGETCKSCDKSEESEATEAQESPRVGSLRNILVSLDKVSSIRTNPKAASQAHKLFLRRQAEDKLRFAYQLDPSHYANYNALHFFLTEPQIGTRPELTPSAAKLAEKTIQYCLEQDQDPRPILTAAACTNILHLIFHDQKAATPKFSTAQMRQCLGTLGRCIGRYVTLAKPWDESKSWDLLSPMRISECDDRFSFICKIRDAAEETIIRFESELQTQAKTVESLKVLKSKDHPAQQTPY